MTDLETPVARKRRRWGCWSVSLSCVGLALLLVLAIYVSWRRAHAAEVARLVEIAREKGEPTTAEELLAILPRDATSERATELWRTAMAAAAIPSENDQLLFGYAAWGVVSGEPVDSTDPPTKDDNGRLTEAGRATAIELTNRLRPAIALAEDAAAFGGATTGLSIEDGDWQSAPFRREYSTLSSLLAVEVERRRDAGDREGVERGIETLMALALASRNEPAAWALLNRIYAFQLVREQCRLAIENGELSDDAVARLRANCERFDYQESARRILLAHQVSEIDRADGDPHDVLDSSFVRWCPEETSALTLASLRELLDACEDPTTFAEVADAVEQGRLELRAIDSHWTLQKHAAARFGAADRRIGSSTHLGYQVRKHLAELRTFEVGLACTRYRAEHGDWPPGLDALVPDYLDAVPIDPFDETPLNYLRDGSGFVVYSVGENSFDDRCRFDPTRRQELDIPFRVDSRLGQ